MTYQASPDRIEERESALSILSKREVEILHLIAEGKANKEIAYDLDISYHTVVNHIRHIFKKLGVQSRTEAMHFAISMKMSDLEPE